MAKSAWWQSTMGKLPTIGLGNESTPNPGPLRMSMVMGNCHSRAPNARRNGWQQQIQTRHLKGRCNEQRTGVRGLHDTDIRCSPQMCRDATTNLPSEIVDHFTIGSGWGPWIAVHWDGNSRHCWKVECKNVSTSHDCISEMFESSEIVTIDQNHICRAIWHHRKGETKLEFCFVGSSSFVGSSPKGDDPTKGDGKMGDMTDSTMLCNQLELVTHKRVFTSQITWT